MKINKLVATLAITILMSGTACSHKGTSSLSSSKNRSTTTQNTPKIRTSQEDAKRDAMKAEAEAEARAKAAAEEAERLRAEAEAEAKAKAEAEAQKIRQAEAEAAAKAKAAAEEKVVVREEKVKRIVETHDNESKNNQYHIIIGSFKVLENARNLCQEAIRNDFLPSIMENEDGLYRVAIFSSSLEKTARNKIADIRKKYPEYVGVWLLVKKK